MVNQWLQEPYLLDINKHRRGGGESCYGIFKEDIPSKLLSKHTLPDDIEVILIEVNLKKRKWLFI